MAILMDTGTSPSLVPLGIAPPLVILLENPTPLSGGPAVTVYLDYNAAVTTGSAAYSIQPGSSVSLPAGNRALYAVSTQTGLLLVNVVTLSASMVKQAFPWVKQR